jgi:hypothetical protein
MTGFDGLVRMVNRSDGAVKSVFVNGRVAFEGGVFDPKFGKASGFGRFLGAGDARPAPAAKPPPRRDAEIGATAA